MGKVVTIVPAYNEGRCIGGLLEETKKHADEVIVVDDGSYDNTLQEAKKHNVTILQHIVNLGKGAAVKTGIYYAALNGAEIIILMDADGQHSPKDIPKFIEKVKLGSDIVFSYRLPNKAMPGVLKLGNFGLSTLTAIFSGIKIRDTQCGFRAFTKSVFPQIEWAATDYGMESEMILNAGKHKLNFSEVPIDTIYKDKFKGTTIIDGLKVFFNMLVWSIIRR